MTDINSILSSAPLPPSAPSVAHAKGPDDASASGGATQLSALPVNPPSTYTALATESASNIRGTGVNQSV